MLLLFWTQMTQKSLESKIKANIIVWNVFKVQTYFKLMFSFFDFWRNEKTRSFKCDMN